MDLYHLDRDLPHLLMLLATADVKSQRVCRQESVFGTLRAVHTRCVPGTRYQVLPRTYLALVNYY